MNASIDVKHRRLPSESGQVLVETCIGVALLAFVWIVGMFATYMANNHIRTAMAARHAAWMKGNGGDPASDIAKIEADFFFQKGITEVLVGKGEGIVDLLSGEDEVTYGNAGAGPFLATVRYGVDSAGGASTSTNFPFDLMTTQLPFMPASQLPGFLRVESSCQWDEVSETWTTWASALEGIWDMILDELGDIKL